MEATVTRAVAPSPCACIHVCIVLGEVASGTAIHASNPSQYEHGLISAIMVGDLRPCCVGFLVHVENPNDLNQPTAISPRLATSTLSMPAALSASRVASAVGVVEEEKLDLPGTASDRHCWNQTTPLLRFRNVRRIICMLSAVHCQHVPVSRNVCLLYCELHFGALKLILAQINCLRY